MEKMMGLKLKIDPERLYEYVGATNIFVRAQGPEEKFGNYDIAQLDKKSLLIWLRSRGGENMWAEDVVGILLGHGHLHTSEPHTIPDREQG